MTVFPGVAPKKVQAWLGPSESLGYDEILAPLGSTGYSRIFRNSWAISWGDIAPRTFKLTFETR